MTSPWVVVPKRSQIYRVWAYPLVVSPSNFSLFWDNRLVPGGKPKGVTDEGLRWW